VETKERRRKRTERRVTHIKGIIILLLQKQLQYIYTVKKTIYSKTNTY
jgi:hypothetical protein